MSSAPDHVYLDLFAINNDTTGSGVRTNLNFTETRTNNILDNPANYFLSVARFEADTPAISLPIFIPALNIDGTNNDPNQTCYTVTMATPNLGTNLLSNVVTRNVIWTPEDQTAPAPSNSIRANPVGNPVNSYTTVAIQNQTASYTSNIITGTGYDSTIVGALISEEVSYTLTLENANIIGSYDNTRFIMEVVNLSELEFPYDIVGFGVIVKPRAGGTDLTIPIESVELRKVDTRNSLFLTFAPGTDIYTFTSNAILSISGTGALLPSGTFITQNNAGDITLSQPYTLPFIPFQTGAIPKYWSIYITSITAQRETFHIASQDITTGYYNCYNVKWWLACVNKALRDCWTALPGNTGLEASAPVLVSDAGTNSITLLTPISATQAWNFAQSEFSAIGNGSAPIYIGVGSSPAVNYSMFFNEPLFNLFSGFPSVYYGNTLTASNFDAPSQAIIAGKYWLFNYYVLPINFQNNNVITLYDIQKNPSMWVSTESEYSPVPMWNPIASLVFTSSLLPVSMSFTSLPQVYNSNPFNQTYANGGNNAQISNMISDIQVGLVSGSEYKPSVLYVPAGEYRLIDILGSNPIFQASFGISWKTKFGQLVAFRLGAQCGANIKILFRRKRFNLGNLAPYDTN